MKSAIAVLEMLAVGFVLIVSGAFVGGLYMGRVAEASRVDGVGAAHSFALAPLMNTLGGWLAVFAVTMALAIAALRACSAHRARREPESTPESAIVAVSPSSRPTLVKGIRGF